MIRDAPAPTHVRRRTAAKPHAAPSICALVQVVSAEEAEYASLLIDLDVRRQRVTDLEAEIAPLLNAFETFERTYDARIGPVQRELREIEQKIAEFEAKIARIHARMVADPDGLLGDLFSREELAEIGDLFGIDTSEWHDEEQARFEHQRFYQHAEDFAPPPPRRRFSEAIEIEMRALYHTLARRFHPDLARDEQDRERRQSFMRRVNAAWQERDLQTLRDLCHQTERDQPEWRQRSVHEQVVWARDERARLDQTVARLVAKLQHLRASSTLPLWTNPALAETVIIRRLAHFTAELDIAKMRLATVQDAFRKALASFALDVA
jgi:hypothetical protein